MDRAIHFATGVEIDIIAGRSSQAVVDGPVNQLHSAAKLGFFELDERDQSAGMRSHYFAE